MKTNCRTRMKAIFAFTILVLTSAGTVFADDVILERTFTGYSWPYETITWKIWPQSGAESSVLVRSGKLFIGRSDIGLFLSMEESGDGSTPVYGIKVFVDSAYIGEVWGDYSDKTSHPVSAVFGLTGKLRAECHVWPKLNSRYATGDGEITYVRDTTGPGVPSLSNSGIAIEGPYTCFVPGSESYYFNPNGDPTIKFTYSVVSDNVGGVGLLHPTAPYQFNYSNQTINSGTPVREVSLKNLPGDFQIKARGQDYFGNAGNWSSVRVIKRDAAGPSVNSTEYTINNVGGVINTYVVTIRSMVSDTGSGINENGSVTLELLNAGDVRDSTGQTVIATGTASIGMTRSSGGQPFEARLTLEANQEIAARIVARDRVSNITSGAFRTLAFPGKPIIGASDGTSEGAVISWTGSSNPEGYLDVSIVTGASFDDSVVGFTLFNLTVGNIATFDLMPNTGVEPESKTYSVDGKTVELVYRLPVTNLAPHGTYQLDGKYQLPGSSVLDWAGDTSVVVPNRPIDSVNDIEVVVQRKDAEGNILDEFTLGSSDFISEVPVQYNDVFFSGGLNLVLNTANDIDGDALTLRYDDGQDLVIGTELSLDNIDIQVEGLSVIEYIAAGESEEYLLPYRFIKDTTLEIGENGYEFDVSGDATGGSMPIPARSDELFEVTITEKNADTSGIAQVVLFKADALASDGAISVAEYKTVLAEDLVDITDGGIVDNTGNTGWRGSVELSEVDAEDSAFRYIGLYVRDNAGNEAVDFRTVLVDKRPPREFILHAGVAKVEREIGEDNEITYLYDSDGTIALVLNSSAMDDPYVDDDGDFSISLTEYEIDWSIPDGENVIIVDDSAIDKIVLRQTEDAGSNEQCSINLTITDYVGNIRSQNVAFYTPVVLEDDVDMYLEAIADVTDVNGGYRLGWTPIDRADVDEYLIYRVSSDSYLDDFEDLDVSSHETVYYRLFGKNGSDFVSAASLDFSRSVTNQHPTTSDVAITNSAFLNDRMIVGPTSIFSFDGDDYDDDVLYLKTFVDEVEWSEVELDGSGDGTFCPADLVTDNHNWVTNTEYTVRFEIGDQWEDDDENLYFGEETANAGTIQFWFDSEPPSVASYEIETRANYSVAYGDLLLSILDVTSAVTNVEVSNQVDDELTVVSTAFDEYNYRVTDVPNGRNISLSVEVTDSVGNSVSIDLAGLNRDDLPPSIDDIGTSLDIWNGSYIQNQPTLPVTLAWRDPDSGFRAIDVRIDRDDDFLTTVSYDTRAGDPGLATGTWVGNLPVSIDPLEDQVYRFWLRIVDRAGNVSEWEELDRSIYFDFGLPTVALSLPQGVTEYRGQHYITNDAVSISLSTYDGLAVVESKVGLFDEDGNEIDADVGNGAGLISLLSDGSEYFLQATVRDAAGNIGEGSRYPFIVDRSAPEVTGDGLNIGSVGDFYPGETISFAVSAEDQASGVSAAHIAIGRLVGGVFTPDLSNMIPGHDAYGIIDLPYYDDSYIYRIPLPNESEPAEYSFMVMFEDGVGNSTAAIYPGSSFIVQTSADRIIVQDYLSVTNNPRRLQASWTYAGDKDISFYQYRVVRSADGSALTPWYDTFERSATVDTSIDLQNNATYSFQVRAVREDGIEIPASTSPGTRIDTGIPEFVSTEVPDFCGSDGFSIGWEISENESVLVSVDVVITGPEFDGSGDVVYEDITTGDGQVLSVPVIREYGVIQLPPVPIMDIYDIDLSALNLPDSGFGDGDEIYVNLRATDAAGNEAEASIGALVLDASPPPVPRIVDQGDYINPLANEARFSWALSPTDEHSGISGYRYQVTVTGGSVDPSNWTEIDRSYDEITLTDVSAIDGTSIVLALEVCNGAGLRRIGYSDGIVVDRSKPEIPEAFISASGSAEAITYLAHDSYQLHMSSQDTESGVVAYEYQLGVYDADGVWSPIGTLENVGIDFPIVTLNIADEEIPAGARFSYLVQSVNGAGDHALLPAMTDPVLYDPQKPIVEWVRPVQVGDAIDISWGTGSNGIPVETATVVLTIGTVEIANVIVPGDVKTCRFDSSSTPGTLNDGLYRLRVSLTNREGIVSDDNPSASASVYYDATQPVLGLSRFDQYVSDKMDFELHASDAGSGIGGYRYRLGTSGMPDLLTGGWIEVNRRTAMYSERIEFSDLPGGELTVSHKDSVILSYQARDLSGNWSVVEYGEPALVDLTTPTAFGFDQNRLISVGDEPWLNEGCYIVRPSVADRLYFSASDEESGVTGYRYVFIREGESVPSSEEWSDFVPFVDKPDFYDATQISSVEFQNTEGFDDQEIWRVLLQVRNRSGLLSDAVASPPLLVDLAPPIVSLDTINSGVHIEPSTDGGQRPVYNDAGSLFLSIDHEIGEIIEIDYTLRSPQGVRLARDSFVSLRTDTPVELPFVPSDTIDNAGLYTMEIDLTDHGARTHKHVQEIRFNAKPSLVISPKETRPGAGVVFDSADTIFDSDGITALTVRIFDSDSQVVDEQNLTNAGSWSVDLFHKDPAATETEYRITVTATDAYGQTAESESLIFVFNTTAGTLYTDEYWSGEHILRGRVIVPEGLQLTVAPGTHIVASPDAGATEHPELVVSAGGSLIHMGPAVYEISDLSSLKLWAGITVFGEAKLDSITVRDALRGIALLEDQIDPIVGIVVEGNETGIHIRNASVSISDAIVRNNRYYGIKEDGVVDTTLIDNMFSGNGWDYYRSGGDIFDADQLNDIPGNSGNSAE